MWSERAKAQIVREIELPAMRGTITDRNGAPLAISVELYSIGIAPREVTDLGALRDKLVKVLGVSTHTARRVTDRRRRWAVVPGRYSAAIKAQLDGIRGVYFEPVIRRQYPQGSLAQAILGRINAEGSPTGGIESLMDSLLSGAPGKDVVLRDAYGRLRQPDDADRVPPQSGSDIALTIDAGLQEAAAFALSRAIDESGAEGGDVVVMNPWTGDILAAVSQHGTSTSSLAMLASPYEPGSVLKPFVYAALLEEQLLTLDDSVYAEKGRYQSNGRWVHDTQPYDWLSYREALSVSSNIAIVKAIESLSPEKQYDYLSAFGFGQSTGLDFPVESKGRLRAPEHWSRVSQGSIAIGYEISATPLQLALAYSILANGGRAVSPRLLLSGTGRSNGLQLGKRVIREETAQEIREALSLVVSDGTGRSADLGAYEVAGKTGTSRAWGDGGYDGHYASFVGIFPADTPQLVIVVRITRPSSRNYYGGSVAAPVARHILASLLSAEAPPIERDLLAHEVARVRAIRIPEVRPERFRWRGLSGKSFHLGDSPEQSSERGQDAVMGQSEAP